MEIKIATIKDNFCQIAELIYETDSYIYPSAFTDKQHAISTLTEMIKSQTIFNYNNCLVATINDQIVGLVVFVSKKTSSSNNYDKWISHSKELSHMIKNYIYKVEKEQKDNTVELVCVCIKKQYRRQKIATKLINHLFLAHQQSNFQLYTLQNNFSAINLYKSLGFSISQEAKGYNSFRKRKPKVYFMTKNKE